MAMFPLGITEKFKRMQIDKGKGNWAKNHPLLCKDTVHSEVTSHVEILDLDLLKRKTIKF